MAEEYTPTVEEIRDCYVAIAASSNWEARTAEFDRWLERVRVEAVRSYAIEQVREALDGSKARQVNPAMRAL